LQLVVGRIGRAHGVLGEATIEVRTDDPEQRFIVGGKLRTGSGKELTIKSARWHNQILLIAFDGINDRDQIESLKDQLISTEVDFSNLAPGEYHYQQLLGAKVFLQNGELVGNVTEIVALSGQDLLAVDHLGREVLIPMVKAIITNIDIANKKIEINPPEGLLDVAL